MEEGFVNINQVPTRVISIGGWIERPLEKKNLILIIPGNPGLIGYYETFAHTLYEQLEGAFPIWGLSHAGHDIPSGAKLPSINEHPGLFTLEGQIKHKQQFIDTYVPKDVKLYLIGHSIGAKICTELLARFSSSASDKRQAYAYLLFPTLERMAETPNGRRLWPILGPLRKPVVLAAALLYRLPESWLSAIVRWFLGAKARQPAVKDSLTSERPATASIHVKTTVRLLHPHALERSLFMAHDELQVVRSLNVEHVRQHSDKMVLYFGNTDQWCPLEYARNLQRLVPEARAVICSQGMEHAFVLQSSQQMALLVAQWIQEHSSS